MPRGGPRGGSMLLALVLPGLVHVGQMALGHVGADDLGEHVLGDRLVAKLDVVWAPATQHIDSSLVTVLPSRLAGEPILGGALLDALEDVARFESGTLRRGPRGGTPTMS